MWSRAFALAIFSALLAGCGQTVVVKTVCPPIVNYDQPYMTRLANEVEAMPADAAALRAIIDYRQLRDVIRACKESG